MKDETKTKEKAGKERQGSKRRKKKVRITVTAVFSALFLLVSLFACFVPPARFLKGDAFPQKEEGEVRLHFVDVGQGDCTLVEFEERLLIIDAGDGSFEASARLLRYIKGLAPKSVSMLLTHPDADHYGGFSDLLDLYRPDVFYYPVISSDAPQYLALQRKIEESGCETQTLTRYATIEDASGAYLVCLSPYSAGEEDANEASAVLYFCYQGVRALFLADITSSREGRLLDEYALDETIFDSGGCTVRLQDIDLLKTAHHGSDTSTGNRLLSLTRPKNAVVSCGRGNDYSHPAAGCIARLKEVGANVYRTDELGSVTARITPAGYTLSYERQGEDE